MSTLRPFDIVLAHEIGHALMGEAYGFHGITMTFGPVRIEGTVPQLDIDGHADTEFSSFGPTDNLVRRQLCVAAAGVVAEIVYEQGPFDRTSFVQRMRSGDNEYDVNIFSKLLGAAPTDDGLFEAAVDAWAFLHPSEALLRNGVAYGMPFLIEHLRHPTHTIRFQWTMIQEAIAKAEHATTHSH